MKVGFIGIGSIGLEMARSLVKFGHKLTVCNRTRSRSAPFAALGAKIAATHAEATENSEAVLTMLADDAATEDVVFGGNGILNSMPHPGRSQRQLWFGQLFCSLFLNDARVSAWRWSQTMKLRLSRKTLGISWAKL